MMRAAVVVLCMSLPLLAGCTDLFKDDPMREAEPADVGYDASGISVTSVVPHEESIPGFGNVTLDAIVYEPVTPDAMPDGTTPPWPVVVFLHGFSATKEYWQNVPLNNENPVPLPPTDLLDAYARQGIIAAAYDARGYGQSGGISTIAGPAELADLDLVIQYIEDNFATNGRVAVVGDSYGGGQALQAWADNPRVTTAMVSNTWADLYEGMIPGNVPKSIWAASLIGSGQAATTASMTDDMLQWMADAALRQNMDRIEAAMDARSIMDRAATTDKPIFMCQAMQDSLFPQAHHVWAATPGFARALYFTGGHNDLSAECFEKGIEWALFFLAGIDTQVDRWPALIAADASDAVPPIGFETHPIVTPLRMHLREGLLTTYEPSNSTFTVSQRVLANPITEPTLLWDTSGLPYQEVPEGFRQDPTAVWFESAPLEESEVLVGAPLLHMFQENGTAAQYQVVGTLYHHTEGSLRLLGRAAYAVLEPTDHDNGTFAMEFPWMHAKMASGDSLVLKLSGNDPSAYAPLLANFEATFNGRSYLDMPLFDPPPATDD